MMVGNRLFYGFVTARLFAIAPAISAATGSGIEIARGDNSAGDPDGSGWPVCTDIRIVDLRRAGLSPGGGAVFRLRATPD